MKSDCHAVRAERFATSVCKKRCWRVWGLKSQRDRYDNVKKRQQSRAGNQSLSFWYFNRNPVLCFVEPTKKSLDRLNIDKLLFACLFFRRIFFFEYFICSLSSKVATLIMMKIKTSIWQRFCQYFASVFFFFFSSHPFGGKIWWANFNDWMFFR